MDTNALIERARSLPVGAELDAMFFEVCWPNTSMPASLWYRYVDGEPVFQKYPHVSTDANACEAWAMRWSRENGLRYEIHETADTVRVRLYDRKGRDFGLGDLWVAAEYGTDWKHALVRACIVAELTIQTRKEPT